MTTADEPPTLDTTDIQGIIVSGYGHLRFSSYHFLRFTNAGQARAWLARIIDQTTTADWGTDGGVKRPDWALNVAFTENGLTTLGLPSVSWETFPQEFREGMFEPHRARRLGDEGESAPERWDLGGPKSEIHALLILQASSGEELANLIHAKAGEYGSHAIAEAVPVIRGAIELDEREHFGFRDSISQPVIEGAPGHAGLDGDTIKPGEFILGYRNEYGVLPATPTASSVIDVKQRLKSSGADAAQRDLGRNGSFLVVRKLLQDVAAFNRFVAENGGADPDERAWLSAKLVGRWPSGAPLVLAPDWDNGKLATSNDFGYTASDRGGFACPLGAHIRRSNPRDSLPSDPVESVRTVRRHRILRRGVSFGDRLPPGETEDDGKPRGLLFLCINADIQRQFEFVQQTWINDPKFNGLSNERDPLVGSNPDHPIKDEGLMTIQGAPVRRRLRGLSRFVTVKGGGYYFLPSLSAMRFLVELQPATA